MAKGQKRSSREVRKPKQAKAKPAPTRSFLDVPAASPAKGPLSGKRAR